MGPVAEIVEAGAEAARLDGRDDGLVDLADEADAQRAPERLVPGAFVRQGIPKQQRIAVLGEQSRVCHTELRRAVIVEKVCLRL